MKGKTMTNEQVVKAFLQKQWANGSNLYSRGKVLISYTTPMAVWKGNVLCINETKYSQSTTKQMSYLWRAANETSVKIRQISWNKFSKVYYSEYLNL